MLRNSVTIREYERMGGSLALCRSLQQIGYIVRQRHNAEECVITISQNFAAFQRIAAYGPVQQRQNAGELPSMSHVIPTKL